MQLACYPFKVGIVACLVVASTTGCTSFATSNVQQSSNGASVNAPNQTVQAKKVDNSTIVSQPKKVRVRTKRTDSLGIKEGMSYAKARELLIKQGWQPNLKGDSPNLNDVSVRELFDLGYKEIKDCSGTGVGACRFEFINQNGELLFVSARIGNTNNERLVWRWVIEKATNTNKQTVSNYNQKLPFIGARFFSFLNGNGTGKSISIATDGTTIVKLNGKFDTTIQYNGKFSNPIILQDGSGLGLLLKDDKIYSLLANGEIAKGCKGDGTICESSLIEVSSPKITDGLYVLGGTDQGLEVKGERYRYYHEEGQKEWRPISELNPVQENVVFDGDNYWCIPPRSEVGVCSKNGWVKAR